MTQHYYTPCEPTAASLGAAYDCEVYTTKRYVIAVLCGPGAWEKLNRCLWYRCKPIVLCPALVGDECGIDSVDPWVEP